jgi:hypothetical protein
MKTFKDEVIYTNIVALKQEFASFPSNLRTDKHWKMFLYNWFEEYCKSYDKQVLTLG